MRSAGDAQQHLLASAGRCEFGQQLRVDGQAGREPGRAEEDHLPDKVIDTSTQQLYLCAKLSECGRPFFDL